jgi:hypothetical protein
MFNDFLIFHHDRTEQQVKDMVAGEMFNFYMTEAGTYSLLVIPRNMAIAYGEKNTFLIPEYDAYRPYSDAILRHAWKYLVSIMPFQLPGHFTYEHYRNRFEQWTEYWAGFTRTRDSDVSINYWIRHFTPESARAKLAGMSDNEKIYDFISREDEIRLNRVIREIDPRFIPVDTSRTRVSR